jgi:hypothetical protein
MGQTLRLSVNGENLLTAYDADNIYPSGGCGFLIDSGSMLADDFTVSANIPSKPKG